MIDLSTHPVAAAAPQTPPSEPAGSQLSSLFDMLLDGGPVMVPIALCSVVALTYTVERSLRMRAGRLGNARLAKNLVAAVRDEGLDKGQELCSQSKTPMARILGAGIARRGASALEIDKAVEDAGGREVRRMASHLRPLVVVAMIAPLLGLLGTVWGMIQAFTNIATADGLGKPELLAEGISQALMTTAAGLAVAIPTHAAYFWLRSRIDGFVRRVEDAHVELAPYLASLGAVA